MTAGPAPEAGALRSAGVHEAEGEQWERAWERLAGPERRILDAAAGLIAQYGYAGAGMREIAGAAAMTAGNLYNHFNSKEDIFFQGLHTAAEILERALNEALADVDTPEARLTIAIRTFLSYIVTQAPWLTFADALGGVHDGEKRDTLVAQRDRFDALYRSLIAAHTGQPARSERVFLATTALVSFIGGVRRWYRAHGALSLDDLAAFALQLTELAAKEPGAGR